MRSKCLTKFWFMDCLSLQELVTDHLHAQFITVKSLINSCSRIMIRLCFLDDLSNRVNEEITIAIDNDILLDFSTNSANIKKMLRQLHVEFVPVKSCQNDVLIGFKSSDFRDWCETRIKCKLSNREHYYNIFHTHWFLSPIFCVSLFSLVFSSRPDSEIHIGRLCWPDSYLLTDQKLDSGLRVYTPVLMLEWKCWGKYGIDWHKSLKR